MEAERTEHWNGLGVQGFAAYSDLVAVQADAGLTTPPVPPHLASELRADRWSWSTTPLFNSFDVYVSVDLDRCLRARTGDFWVYGHNGHGINSYAIGLIARAGGLLVAQQHGFAGAYMGDNTNAVNAANTAWSHLLTQLNPAEHDCTVAVIFSEYRGYADILSSEDRYLPTSEVESLVDVPEGWALVVTSSSRRSSSEQLQEVAPKGSARMRLAAQHPFRLVYPDEAVPEYGNRRRIR